MDIVSGLVLKAILFILSMPPTNERTNERAMARATFSLTANFFSHVVVGEFPTKEELNGSCSSTLKL